MRNFRREPQFLRQLPKLTMKIKTLIFTGCVATATLLSPSFLVAQTASPAPSASLGATPKFGPDDKQPGKRGGRRSPEERLAHLKEKLALTAEQETSIRDLFQKEMEEIKAEREANKGNKPSPEERRAKMKEHRDKMDAAIGALLTPEQKEKWEKMKADRKDREPKDGPKGHGPGGKKHGGPDGPGGPGGPDDMGGPGGPGAPE